MWLQFGLQFNAVRRRSGKTVHGRRSSLNRSGRPRPELLMRWGNAGHCQERESLTVFSRTDRTVRDYGAAAGHRAGFRPADTDSGAPAGCLHCSTDQKVGGSSPSERASSTAGSDLGTGLSRAAYTAKYSNADRNGGSSGGLAALVLVMVEPVAQPPKCVPGHLVGGPGCRSPL